MATVTVRDETPSGRAIEVWVLPNLPPTITAPIGIARRMNPALWRDVRPVLDRLFAWLEHQRDLSRAGQNYLIKVLGQAFDGGSGLPRSALHRGDAFDPSSRTAFADELTGDGLGQLLSHCATADKLVPTKKWLQPTRRLGRRRDRRPSVDRAGSHK